MSDAQRIWREKSDDDLLEAAANLDEFTEEGKWIIRSELSRRGLEDPVQQAGGAWAGTVEEALECLRCRARLRYLDPNEDGPLEGALTKSRLPIYPPGGPFRMYACPQCGHVELFLDLAQEG
jgi:hypothetical protein